MKKFTIVLLMLGLVSAGYGKAIRVLPELVFPSFLETDGKHIFVLDQVQVYVYSLEDYKLTGQFGKQGEGPGELMTQPDLPATMLVQGDHVILNSFNKMVTYTKSGEFVTEKKIPFILSQMIPFGDHHAVSRFNRLQDGSSKVSVMLLDDSLETVREVYETALLNDQGRGRVAFPLLTVYIRVAGDKLYVYNQQDGFKIRVYDLAGNQVGEISRTYEKIKIDPAYKKAKMEWLLKQPAVKQMPLEVVKKWIYFLDELPVLVHFLIKDDKIYGQTSRTRNSESESEFLVLDLGGKILDQRFLPNAKQESIRINPAANYAFDRDRYFYLRETEDDEWELCVEKIK